MRQTKRAAAFLLMLALLVSFLPVRAAGPNGLLNMEVHNETTGRYEPQQAEKVNISLDGTVVDLTGDVPGLALGTRTMVPIRTVAEALGATVLWPQGSNQVILRKGADTIVLTLGSADAVVNGQAVPLPDGVPACVVKHQGVERTMVPLRFVSEQLGAQVGWDQATFTASITSPYQPEPEPIPTPEPTPTPTPIPTPEPGDPETGDAPGYVEQITADANAQTIQIRTDHAPVYKVLDFEDRVVIDILDAALAPGFPETVTADNDLISAVRVAQHADDLGYGCDSSVRVVLDLKEGATLAENVRVSALASGILVTTFLNDDEHGDIDFTPSIPINPQKSTIVLDPGHGGSAWGATYEGYKEKDINLPVARKVQALLLAQGYNVVMTRTDDSYVDLYERADIANAVEADIFVSIHSNAAENRPDYQGIYTYYHPSSQRGKKLALAIQEPLSQITGGLDRGVRSNDYVILRETDMCAVLVEMGFMSNHDELMKLINDSYQDKLAQGIAEGIVRYLNSLNGQ